jgi:hypothetical protein
MVSSPARCDCDRRVNADAGRTESLRELPSKGTSIWPGRLCRKTGASSDGARLDQILATLWPSSQPAEVQRYVRARSVPDSPETLASGSLARLKFRVLLLRRFAAELFGITHGHGSSMEIVTRSQLTDSG